MEKSGGECKKEYGKREKEDLIREEGASEIRGGPTSRTVKNKRYARNADSGNKSTRKERTVKMRGEKDHDC